MNFELSEKQTEKIDKNINVFDLSYTEDIKILRLSKMVVQIISIFCIDKNLNKHEEIFFSTSAISKVDGIKKNDRQLDILLFERINLAKFSMYKGIENYINKYNCFSLFINTKKTNNYTKEDIVKKLFRLEKRWNIHTAIP